VPPKGLKVPDSFAVARKKRKSRFSATDGEAALFGLLLKSPPLAGPGEVPPILRQFKVFLQPQNIEQVSDPKGRLREISNVEVNDPDSSMNIMPFVFSSKSWGQEI